MHSTAEIARIDLSSDLGLLGLGEPCDEPALRALGLRKSGLSSMILQEVDTCHLGVGWDAAKQRADVDMNTGREKCTMKESHLEVSGALIEICIPSVHNAAAPGKQDAFDIPRGRRDGDVALGVDPNAERCVTANLGVQMGIDSDDQRDALSIDPGLNQDPRGFIHGSRPAVGLHREGRFVSVT